MSRGLCQNPADDTLRQISRALVLFQYYSNPYAGEYIFSQCSIHSSTVRCLVKKCEPSWRRQTVKKVQTILTEKKDILTNWTISTIVE